MSTIILTHTTNNGDVHMVEIKNDMRVAPLNNTHAYKVSFHNKRYTYYLATETS